MKKYKQFLIGFLVGAMLFSSIGVFAEGIAVLLNPYPILFNGQVAKVEAYNINSRTFMALGDVAKYFNATATLNETTKQIEINSNIDIQALQQNVIREIKTTPDGIETKEINGLDYVQIGDIRHKYFTESEKSYTISIQPEKDGNIKFYLYDPDKKSSNSNVPEYKIDKRIVLINDVPAIGINESNIRTNPLKYYVQVEYYINDILPLIDIEPLY